MNLIRIQVIDMVYENLVDITSIIINYIINDIENGFISGIINYIINDIENGFISAIITSAPAGFVTGIVFTIIYIIQKLTQRHSDKYNLASILYNEIKSNSNYYIPRGPTIKNYAERLPSDDIYHGLLFSGNIKYFDSQLQSNLGDMYPQFLALNFKINLDLLSNIIKKLESMKYRHEYYGISLRRFRRNK